MYDGITQTKFGRLAIASALRPDRLHFHDGSPLKETDWEPPIPVLDQEDLGKQDIHVSALVPGAQDVDALGSCTCNAGTAHLAERYAAKHGTVDLPGIGISAADSRADEIFAITLYHKVTWQTGSPATEWPPTDCGSSGFYVCEELERQGLASGHKTAMGAEGLASLLQSGSVMLGCPWFKSWMEPDAQGFVDGDGSADALRAAISSGVAGGHETCVDALERLVLTGTGAIDPFQSHVRVRNSWSSAWGDSGSYRLRLSTIAMLGSYADLKQIAV